MNNALQDIIDALGVKEKWNGEYIYVIKGDADFLRSMRGILNSQWDGKLPDKCPMGKYSPFDTWYIDGKFIVIKDDGSKGPFAPRKKVL